MTPPRLKNEYWKVFPLNSKYMVSNLGRIWGSSMNRVLKFSKDPKGYLRCSIPTGDRKMSLVHRIVLITFKGKSDMLGLHIDGNPSNNRIDNLMWGTSKTNAEHARIHGTKPIGQIRKQAVLTDSDVLYIIENCRPGVMGKSIHDFGRMFNIDRTTISAIYSGRTWRHITGFKDKQADARKARESLKRKGDKNESRQSKL